jgi:hypothetical protein
MPLSRLAFAQSRHRFGRRPVRTVAAIATDERAFGDDLRLFAATFAAGFLFVSILIG